MTTLADLARVERELRDPVAWQGHSSRIRMADTIAAFIAAQRARDLVANLSAELSRVTQKGHANG